MASNLRAKLPATDTLVIHDRNPELGKKFKEETTSSSQSNGASVEVVDSPRAAAEHSVSRWISFHLAMSLILHEEIVLSYSNDLSWEIVHVF